MSENRGTNLLQASSAFANNGAVINDDMLWSIRLTEDGDYVWVHGNKRKYNPIFADPQAGSISDDKNSLCWQTPDAYLGQVTHIEFSLTDTANTVKGLDWPLQLRKHVAISTLDTRRRHLSYSHTGSYSQGPQS